MSTTPLKNLLKTKHSLEATMLVSICERCGSDNNLLDNIIEKVIAASKQNIRFKKFAGEEAKQIKAELQLAKAPITLIIHKGEIKTVFTGMVAGFRLEEALRELIVN